MWATPLLLRARLKLSSIQVFEPGTITRSGGNITGQRAVWTLEQSCSTSELSAAFSLRLDYVSQRPAVVINNMNTT